MVSENSLRLAKCFSFVSVVTSVAFLLKSNKKTPCDGMNLVLPKRFQQLLILWSYLNILQNVAYSQNFVQVSIWTVLKENRKKEETPI